VLCADLAVDHAAFDLFDADVFARGVDILDDVDINAGTCGLRADCTLRYPLNNGYRSVWRGMFTSPDPLHMQTQLRHIGAQAYTYAANRPQVNQDPDGRFPIAALPLLACGLFPERCLAIVDYLYGPFATKSAADAEAQRDVPGRGWDDPQDAYRHCLASCELARRYGPGSTLGDLNEVAAIPSRMAGLDNRASTEMDKKNNSCGEKLGADAEDWQHCQDLCMGALNGGSLQSAP
jgi:hypothetical protein